jgi:hypothetical protein
MAFDENNFFNKFNAVLHLKNFVIEYDINLTKSTSVRELIIIFCCELANKIELWRNFCSFRKPIARFDFMRSFYS